MSFTTMCQNPAKTGRTDKLTQTGQLHSPSGTISSLRHSLWNDFGQVSHSSRSPPSLHSSQYQ